MENLDVCICEPFMLAGTLPTLAPAIIKASLEKAGYKTKIFYPSIEFFYENKIMRDKDILQLIDDIPLQVVDFFFSKNTDVLGKLKKSANDNSLTKDVIDKLLKYRKIVNEKLRNTAKNICKHSPRILCCSLTFGGLDFVEALFQEVRKWDETIIFVVGGSNCTLDFSRTLIKETLNIQYVICDETTESLVKLVESIIDNKPVQIDSVSCKTKIAKKHIVVEDLNQIDCPDFDDYYEVIKRIGINVNEITLPYEISRGCWWCEQKPCVMCGFYGVRKKFIIKKPETVIKDLNYLSDRYGVQKIRFSDLVNPHYEYLQKLTALKALNINFFWELRPDINEKMIDKLREIGMTFAQIGIESLSTPCLLRMNKGTTGIHNIFLLLLADTYKIDFVWNYLYGFPWDCREWYENVISIIPLLYHLQPPLLRKVWINKYSDWYYEAAERGELLDEYQNLSDINESNLKTFFSVQIKSEKLYEVYSGLMKSIRQWKECRKSGYALYVDYSDDEYLHIVREYEKRSHYRLSGIHADIYRKCFEPITKDMLISAIDAPRNQIEQVLQYFIDSKIMIFLDDRYLSLAIRQSKYQWIDPMKQVMNMKEDI